MADDDGKNNDFYAVLGLKKECSTSELKTAYKKQALKWHPDRCAVFGNSNTTQEAKEKFQAIQEAYSVLSDENKRFLYDVGVYDCDDDDDEDGMSNFLNEMAAMMNQNKPNDNVEDSFEDLQELFKEMFQSEIDAYSSSQAVESSSSGSSSFASYCDSSNMANKRNSTDMISGKSQVRESLSTDAHAEEFCFGAEYWESPVKSKGGKRGGRIGNRAASNRRDGRRQKVSSSHDVSSSYCSSTSDS